MNMTQSLGKDKIMERVKGPVSYAIHNNQEERKTNGRNGEVVQHKD